MLWEKIFSAERVKSAMSRINCCSLATSTQAVT